MRKEDENKRPSYLLFLYVLDSAPFCVEWEQDEHRHGAKALSLVPASKFPHYQEINDNIHVGSVPLCVEREQDEHRHGAKALSLVPASKSLHYQQRIIFIQMFPS